MLKSTIQHRFFPKPMWYNKKYTKNAKTTLILPKPMSYCTIQHWCCKYDTTLIFAESMLYSALQHRFFQNWCCNAPYKIDSCQNWCCIILTKSILAEPMFFCYYATSVLVKNDVVWCITISFLIKQMLFLHFFKFFFLVC